MRGDLQRGTRVDPLEAVWSAEAEPWLRREGGGLQGRTVLAKLQEDLPGAYPDGLMVRAGTPQLQVMRPLSGNSMAPMVVAPGAE